MTRRLLDVGLVRLASAVLLAACASAPAGKTAYIAPTSETITSETEQGRGSNDRPTHTIYVTNRSTVPIIVWGTQLLRCENIKPRCEARTTNYRIGAGSRTVVQRVEQENLQRNWTYNFTFSWRPDTSARTAATKALAEAGDEGAQQRLAAIQRADSLRRLGPGYRYLSQEEHVVLRERVAMLRAEPESLVLAPGERTGIDGIRVLLVDGQGTLLGRTRFVGFRLSGTRAVQFVPSGGVVSLVALRPGRATLTYTLADEIRSLMTRPVNEVEVPVVVRYVFDEHAPEFSGTLADSATKAPIRCAKVSLEDGMRNAVNQTRSDAKGAFSLRAPRAGIYRVRVDLNGWAPFNGPDETAAADAKLQSTYPVQFVEQITTFRPVMMEDPDDVRARLTGAASPNTAQPGAAPGQLMRLGGSASLPILEVISTRVPPASLWAQFTLDDAGRLDTASVVLPAGTAANARAAVMRALPQLRFEAAREGGKPTCELMRLTVNFTPR